MSETSQNEKGQEQVERIAPGQDPIQAVEKWFQKSDTKWENIKPGETRVFIFVVGKTERVTKTFNGQEKTQYRFTVINEDNVEKTIDFSPRWAQTIVSFLKEGYQKIKITRKGASTDTSYSFVPLQH